MSYAIVGFMALLIILTINSDIIFQRVEEKKASYAIAYRQLLYCILLFCFVDGMWGVLNEIQCFWAIFIDTTLFFATMAVTVLLWARYVVRYIVSKSKISKFWNIFLMVVSYIIFTYTIVIIIINLFPDTRILFDFGKEASEHDQNGYDPNIARYILFGLQVATFLLTSIVAFYNAIKAKDNMKHRHFTIGGFGIVMCVAIIAQIFFPFLALYTIGLLLGTCLIHTFVVASSKEEKRKILEESLSREKEHQQELFSTKNMIYRDPLTGAKSKHAYVEMEDGMEHLVAFRTIKRFAVIVFDVNGLKQINDTLGHDYGDKYIKDSYKAIVDHFPGSEVYRFGGDEFVLVLKDLEYERKDEMLEAFDNYIESNLGSEAPVVSSGMAIYNEKEDNTFKAVFERADEKMYERKRYLKSITNYLKK